MKFPFATVTANADPSVGSLVISAQSYDRLYAVQMANLFTTELLRYLNGVGIEKYNYQISADQALAASLETRVLSLNSQIAAAGSSPAATALISERDAASKQIDSTNQTLFQTTQAGSAFSSLLATEMDVFSRKDPTQTGVEVSQTIFDEREPERRYIPGHPDADPQGYVSFPRVNPAEEMVDLMSASRGFQANVSAMAAVKDMLNRSIDLLK